MDHNFVDFDLTDVPADQAAGCVEQSPAVFCSAVQCDDYESFGSEMIPRSRWREWAESVEENLRSLVKIVTNQGREGSCVGNACVGAAMACSQLQYGEKYWRPLSAMSIYNRIGRSPSSGAYIPDGINEMADEGILPLDTAENREQYQHVYRARGFVGERRMERELPNWQETAKLFRLTRVLRINTVDAWFSALVQGRPIVYGRSGHAIYSLLPRLHRGDWFFGYVNSWGAWGDEVNGSVGRGLGWDSERTIRRCLGYAVCEISTRPEMGV